MNFWHMQQHPNDEKKYTKERVLQTLQNHLVIGLSEKWENDKNIPDKFRNEIRLGDIVMILSEGPLALVEIIGECEKNNGQDFWFEIYRRVKILSLEGNKFKESYKNHENKKWKKDVFPPITLQIANNSEFIQYWYNNIMGKSQIQNILNLLTYKKQVILHGPPGTGKTYTAKQMAEEMTSQEEKSNPLDRIKELVKNFVPDKNIRNENQSMLSKFKQQFPAAELKNLTLENYCLGTGEKENFCWWINFGLRRLGSYRPGGSGNYLIYWNSESNGYKKHERLKDDSDEEAMKKIAGWISEIVEQKKPNQEFDNGFQLKVLVSYYPEEYFPITSQAHLNNALALFKLNFTGDFFEKNRRFHQFYLDVKAELKSDIDQVEFMYLLYEHFNLRDGEKITNDKIISQGKYKIVQFHPAYSYEDFIRGIVSDSEDNQISYNVKNKVLADFAQDAKEDPNANYVLIVDEINRANLPAVLGELIYALEYRGEAVESMYELEGSNDIVLPKNLYIIGTMNTADRSVGHIDYAIRRRFAFVEMPPDESVIGSKKGVELFRKVESIFSKENISPEFRKEDVMIGHSYFMAKDDEELKLKLEYEIKPILKEYLKDGVLLEGASGLIDDLSV